MADIEKISISGTSYDIKDVTALRNESTSTTVGLQGLSIGGNNSVTGNNQVVIGYYAGQNSWSYQGGTIEPDNQNISIGFGAGSMPYDQKIYTGGNISIGQSANSVSGILGYSEGYSAADYTNCIAIGNLSHAFGNHAIAIGSAESSVSDATEAREYSVAIGSNAKAISNNSVSIGRGSAASSNYSTAIGYQASTSATSSLALGRNSAASATYAIQLGRGTNSTANTFNVGLSMSDNYTLLESDGTIPNARLKSDVPHKVSYTNPALTAVSGVCTWTVTHTLGTTDFVATVFDTTTGKEVMFEGIHTSSTVYTINLTSNTDIASGAYKVVMIG